MTRLHRRRRERNEYTEDHVEALTTGFDWWRSFQPEGVETRVRFPEGDDDQEYQAKREAWDELRDVLMADWILARPFSRPWGWWKFDAPERRRCLTGEHPYDRSDFPAHVHKRYTSGVPSIMAGPGMAIRHEFEAERDYLIRLNLLTDTERQLLANESPTTTPAPATVE